MAVNIFHTLPECCIAAMCTCFRYPDANGNGEAQVVCAFSLAVRRVDVKQELLETMRVVMGLRIEAAVEQNLPCAVHVKYLAVPGVWDKLVELQLLGVDVSQPQNAGLNVGLSEGSSSVPAASCYCYAFAHNWAFTHQCAFKWKRSQW